MSTGPEKPETENQASKMSLSKVVAYAPLGHNPPQELHEKHSFIENRLTGETKSRQKTSWSKQPPSTPFSILSMRITILRAVHSLFITEMPRPIETLLTLPRVRLINKVPILETGKLVQRFMSRHDYHQRLAKSALQVSEGSAQQFSIDDEGLSTLLDEITTANYIVTKRSRTAMEEMLKGIYGDGLVFKEFESEIKPLYDVSQDLRRVSRLADSLADKTKEESLDVARALLIQLPKPTSAE